jgi:FkbM family methyltransferase
LGKTRPGKLSLRSLGKKIKKIPFRFVQYLLKNSSEARALFFETSKGEFIVANGDESYIVSTKDKIIAKSLFRSSEFDLDKFFLAQRLANISNNDFTLIDVGANVGSICLPLVKRGIVSDAIAIEPDPYNFKLLRANSIINSVEDRVVAINKALGATDGDNLTFELCTHNFGDHRVHSEKPGGMYNEENRNHIKVDSTTLDSVLSEHKRKNLFLWMDVQGYEGHVLKGASDTLKEGYPMVIEFWPYGLDRADSYPALKEALIGSNYSVFYDLDEKTPKPIKLDATELDAMYHRFGDKGGNDILLTQ